ncbi:MAG: hypothetical protein ACTHJT_08910 [Cytophaga sp.]|uniref:hypothetical protein n=1 Tax=Cytophaga sp. TaxID=29535 RepID=UPI003F7D5407
MDKIKSKYEIILGFATLIISLSAFKNELAQVSLDLGYITITLSDYFLLVVYGFSICLYLYVIEKIVQDTKIGKWKLFNYTIQIAYFLFTFILITPLLIGVNILAFKLYSITNNYEADWNLFIGILNLILTIITSFFSGKATRTFLEEKKRKLQEEVEIEEIKNLNNAIKLFKDDYYPHSILESFKALENHLYKKIIDKDIRVGKHRFNDILEIALKENFINQEDLSIIHDIRVMRNSVAHSDMEFTKSNAEFALNYVRTLLNRKIQKTE